MSLPQRDDHSAEQFPLLLSSCAILLCMENLSVRKTVPVITESLHIHEGSALQKDISAHLLPICQVQLPGSVPEFLADFPDDLTPYDLVIHCGACMFNRRYVLSRVAQAKKQGVPMTNYGIILARFAGILDRIELPGK